MVASTMILSGTQCDWYPISQYKRTDIIKLWINGSDSPQPSHKQPHLSFFLYIFIHTHDAFLSSKFSFISSFSQQPKSQIPFNIVNLEFSKFFGRVSSLKVWISSPFWARYDQSIDDDNDIPREERLYDGQVFRGFFWLWDRGVTLSGGVGGVYDGSSVDVAAVTASAIGVYVLPRWDHGGSHVLGVFAGGCCGQHGFSDCMTAGLKTRLS
ncbi:hypothetical protein V6N13_091588 [Hibiscus sabdariffa]